MVFSMFFCFTSFIGYSIYSVLYSSTSETCNVKFRICVKARDELVIIFITFRRELLLQRYCRVQVIDATHQRHVFCLCHVIDDLSMGNEAPSVGPPHLNLRKVNSSERCFTQFSRCFLTETIPCKLLWIDGVGHLSEFQSIFLF